MIRSKLENIINDADLFILAKIGLAYEPNNSGELNFCIIRNRDKTVRWLFPSTSDYPTFLNFYNANTWMSKFYVFCIRIIFKIGLNAFVFNEKISCSLATNSPLRSVLEDYRGCDYSIFTGTIGINRKVIIEISRKGKSCAFAKFPITNASLRLVQNERAALRSLLQVNLGPNEVPKVLKSHADFLVVNNIRPNRYKSVLEITEKHLRFLGLMYNNSKRVEFWPDIVGLSEVEANMRKAADILNNKSSSGFNLKLSNLHRLISLIYRNWDWSGNIVVGQCHGDFTPWNMFVGVDRLHVIDWELSSTNKPLLYDLFHYIFQTNILLKKKGFMEIWKVTKIEMQRSYTQDLLRQFNIDWRLYYKFYLVHVSSYYCLKYLEQREIHKQAYWLVDTWTEALEQLLESNDLV